MRFQCLMLAVLVILSGTVYAESTRTSDEVIFSVAMEELRNINSKESVELACQALSGITSNYNNANMFRIYAEAVLDVYNEQFDDAQTKLYVLDLNESFKQMLSQNGLQACDVINQYINARRLETEGQDNEAFEIYSNMNFLDSLDRSIDLAASFRENSYNTALHFYQSGSYEEAARAFEALGQYKDSASMAERSRALVPGEQRHTSGANGLNVPLPEIDWSNNADEKYMAVYTNLDFLNEASLQDYLRWLNDEYAIPGIASEVGSEGLKTLIPSLLDSDTSVAAIMVFGYDAQTLKSSIDYCTEKAMPIWIANVTDDKESMRKATSDLFEGIYASNNGR